MLLVGAFSSVENATQIARDLHGTVVADEREDTAHLPFAALAWGDTDDLPGFLEAADVGAWLVNARTIRLRPTTESGRLDGVIGVYPMIKKPGLSHADSDAHWRDNHAPLALEIHILMHHYRQLAIQHRFHGLELDGIALCGMPSERDARENFFNNAAGRRAIMADIARFADTNRSPRRLIAVETVFE